MEWPNSRVDGVALTLFGAGWAALALPESITLHPVWLAVICWVGAILIFVCGFPVVQGRLRILQGKFLTFCKRNVVSYPFGAPVAFALVVMVGVLILGGVGWLLLRGGTPGTAAQRGGLTRSGESGKQLSEQVARLASRGITEDQRQKMQAVLRMVPPGVTYKLVMSFPEECTRCFDYVKGLLSAWDGMPGWHVREHRNASLTPQFEGAWIDTNMKECPPEEVRLIERALRAANIEPRLDPAGGDRMGFAPGFCMMLVGNKM